MTKEELRKVYLQKRISLSEFEYANLNTRLTGTFFNNVDLTGIQFLHSFLPLEKFKEPDTWQIINRLRSEFPEIGIYLPRVNDKTQNLESIFFEGSHLLAPSKWGIPEPVDGTPIDPEKLDMVLVPMLIFDKRGHRVGYGKGFYDKFLSSCRKDCKRVGISFFDPVDQIEGITTFDIPVDCCITPNTFYSSQTSGSC